MPELPPVTRATCAPPHLLSACASCCLQAQLGRLYGLVEPPGSYSLQAVQRFNPHHSKGSTSKDCWSSTELLHMLIFSYRIWQSWNFDTPNTERAAKREHEPRKRCWTDRQKDRAHLACQDVLFERRLRRGRQAQLWHRLTTLQVSAQGLTTASGFRSKQRDREAETTYVDTLSSGRTVACWTINALAAYMQPSSQ